MHRPGKRLPGHVGSGGTDVLGRGAEEDLIGARSRLPGRCPLIERGQGVAVHGHRKYLAFTRCEFLRLGEGLEFPDRFLQAAGRSAHVEFHHFAARDGSRIGHRNGGGEAIGSRLHHRLGIGEGRVTEAETEGIGDVHSLRRVIAIPDPDILRIAGEVHIVLPVGKGMGIVVVREIARGRDIDIRVREGHGQFSGRIHLPREDIGDSVRTFLAGRPGKKDGIGKMLPGGGFDHAAHIEDHDHALSPGPVILVQVLQQFPFRGGEFEIVLHVAVLPFAGLAAEHHHGHIVQRCLVSDGGSGERGSSRCSLSSSDSMLKRPLQGLGVQG